MHEGSRELDADLLEDRVGVALDDLEALVADQIDWGERAREEGCCGRGRRCPGRLAGSRPPPRRLRVRLSVKLFLPVRTPRVTGPLVPKPAATLGRARIVACAGNLSS